MSEYDRARIDSALYLILAHLQMVLSHVADSRWMSGLYLLGAGAFLIAAFVSQNRSSRRLPASDPEDSNG